MLHYSIKLQLTVHIARVKQSWTCILFLGQHLLFIREILFKVVVSQVTETTNLRNILIPGSGFKVFPWRPFSVNASQARLRLMTSNATRLPVIELRSCFNGCIGIKYRQSKIIYACHNNPPTLLPFRNNILEEVLSNHQEVDRIQ